MPGIAVPKRLSVRHNRHKISPVTAAVILVLLAGGFAVARDVAWIVVTGHPAPAVNLYRGG